ncbi:DUF2339 domain-containing protein [Fodinibius sp. SL11]|uniref:DUF2339 domain-containing protein n=1 Tax=Fodinibius sp. SL11 TaxID=3425690 RepID=UPI003F882F16
MSDQSYDKLQNRIERLERRVNELEDELTRSAQAKVSSTREKVVPDKSQDVDRSWETLQLGEQWLNNIGIALLLIGIIFLFKYSIDQGWLIPQVRSAVGVIAGLLLLGFGLKMDESLSPFRQIVMGGGNAAFYITGFATFQLFSFVPTTVVWGFMIFVTLLSFWLSLQQEEAVLAVIGTLGALGTPFMLYSGEGEIVGLILYFVLILGPTSILYIKKEWLSLLWSVCVGGMLVLAAAIITNIARGNDFTSFESWVMFGGIMIWLMVSWLVPVFKEVFDRSKSGAENTEQTISSSIHIFVLGVPVIGVLFSVSVWEWTMDQAGMASLVLALAAGGFYSFLKHRKLTGLASTHASLGLVLVTAGLFLILEGEVLFTVFVIELMALRYLAHHTDDKKISVGSHVLFGITVWWLINKLEHVEATSFIIEFSILPELVLILAGGLWIPQYLKRKDSKNIYQGLSHLMLLYWLYQKLIPLENSQAWISLVWGVYAIGLIVLGLMWFGKRARLVGLATIFLVIIKLFLVDLAQLQAIWRILLFMGFGSLLLIIGYLIQSKLLEKSS